MSWFRRGRKADDADPVAWVEPDERDGSADPDGPDHEDVVDVVDVEDAASAPADLPGGAFDRSAGPWDLDETDSAEGYVDLGGIRVLGRDGMELRLEVEESTDRVTAATVQLGGSAVQLQAFAAPRTEGLWGEIRAEIAAGITRQGGTADEVPGVFGRELLAHIPVRTPDGRSATQPARFVGVDGPRWFLRAVFHGPAAYETGAAGDLEQVVRDVVVVRGPDAMAPRELIVLRLPDAPADAEPEPEEEGREPLRPFERGPEITETR